jgi:hypothetical protein
MQQTTTTDDKTPASAEDVRARFAPPPMPGLRPTFPQKGCRLFTHYVTSVRAALAEPPTQRNYEGAWSTAELGLIDRAGARLGRELTRVARRLAQLGRGFEVAATTAPPHPEAEGGGDSGAVFMAGPRLPNRGCTKLVDCALWRARSALRAGHQAYRSATGLTAAATPEGAAAEAWTPSFWRARWRKAPSRPAPSPSCSTPPSTRKGFASGASSGRAAAR